ncbi:MAG: biotin--[acetyl-CoA-carboxylase] ligase [Actinomycetota bacterium]|nr:biotin--[acetyl-CoA-carboxylase] ligase [Actinomycetota bacterium]
MSGLNREAIERLGSPLAKQVDFHEEIGSTQERARALAHEGAPHGTLVISRTQTGGRGRLGRGWISPSGGLWMSLILRPNILASLAPRITQAAAVGVAKALWGFGVEVRIKWPNDLLVVKPGEPPDRKICGILAETWAENVPVTAKHPGPGDGRRRPDFVILGVGLNANLDPEDLNVPDREVATLRSELGHDVDLVKLLGSLLSNLDAELERIKDFSAVLDDWRALNCTLGKPVRVQRFGEVLEGRAADLTPEGALLLETPDGTVELFEGEVEHLRQKGT